MIHPAQTFRRIAPTLFAVCAAALLFGLLWRANPAPTGDGFDWTRPEARWPEAPPFTFDAVPRPIFYDLQVLLWGIESHRQGLDPYTPDPAGRPFWFNYPSIWLGLAESGASLSWTRPLGLALAAAFVATALLVAAPRRPAGAAWFALLLFSPAALESVSHGNNDLLIFLLLAGAAAMWAWRRPLGGWPALGLLGLAATLKLYPACVLLAFLDGRRRAWIAAFVTGAALVVYFAFHFHELLLVSERTPRPHVFAVGCQVLSSRLLSGAGRAQEVMDFFERAGGLATWSRLLPAASYAALLALLGVCGWFGARAPAETDTPASAPSRACFRMGGWAFLACFAIGHNYIHREILLFLVGAWLLARPRTAWLAWLAAAVAWLGAAPTGMVFFLAQIGSWILAGGLAYWLVRDLAPEARQALGRFKTSAA